MGAFFFLGAYCSSVRAASCLEVVYSNVVDEEQLIENHQAVLAELRKALQKEQEAFELLRGAIRKKSGEDICQKTIGQGRLKEIANKAEEVGLEVWSALTRGADGWRLESK